LNTTMSKANPITVEEGEDDDIDTIRNERDYWRSKFEMLQREHIRLINDLQELEKSRKGLKLKLKATEKELQEERSNRQQRAIQVQDQILTRDPTPSNFRQTISPSNTQNSSRPPHLLSFQPSRPLLGPTQPSFNTGLNLVSNRTRTFVQAPQYDEDEDRRLAQRLQEEEYELSAYCPDASIEPMYRPEQIINSFNQNLHSDVGFDPLEDATYEALVQLESVKVGVKKEILDLLPVTTFNGRREKYEKPCSICLSSFEDGEKVTTLFCLDRFHADCINKWFAINHNCPVCRTDMNEINTNSHYV